MGYFLSLFLRRPSLVYLFVLSYRILHSYIQLPSTSAAREGFPDPPFNPCYWEKLSAFPIMREEMNHLLWHQRSWIVTTTPRNLNLGFSKQEEFFCSFFSSGLFFHLHNPLIWLYLKIFLKCFMWDSACMSLTTEVVWYKVNQNTGW